MASKRVVQGGAAGADPPPTKHARVQQTGLQVMLECCAQSDLHAPITHPIRPPFTHSLAFVLGANTLNM
eukprot:scaffold322419_cov15-Tisochrysis_lutea.AAC.1